MLALACISIPQSTSYENSLTPYPGKRTGRNPRYSMADVTLAAMQQAKGRNNDHTWFGSG